MTAEPSASLFPANRKNKNACKPVFSTGNLQTAARCRRSALFESQPRVGIFQRIHGGSRNLTGGIVGRVFSKQRVMPDGGGRLRTRRTVSLFGCGFGGCLPCPAFRRHSGTDCPVCPNPVGLQTDAVCKKRRHWRTVRKRARRYYGGHGVFRGPFFVRQPPNGGRTGEKNERAAQCAGVCRGKTGGDGTPPRQIARLRGGIGTKHQKLSGRSARHPHPALDSESTRLGDQPARPAQTADFDACRSRYAFARLPPPRPHPHPSAFKRQSRRRPPAVRFAAASRRKHGL